MSKSQPKAYENILKDVIKTLTFRIAELEQEKQSGPDVQGLSAVCVHENKTKIRFGISDSICDNCGERIKQTVL